MIASIRKLLILLNKLERKKVSILLLLGIIGMFLEILSIGLVVPLVGLMMPTDIASEYPSITPVLEYFDNPSKAALIGGAMLIFVLFYLIKGLFLSFTIWKQTSFAYNLQQRIAEQLFKSYLLKPYLFHLKINTAELIRNTTTEVTYFTFVTNALIQIVTEVFVVIGIASILIYIEPIGSITIILVLAIAVVLFFNATKKRLNLWGGARQYHDGMRLQHLKQGLGGVKEAKLYGRELEFLKQFELHNYHSTRINGFQTMLQLLPRLGLEFLTVLGLTVLIFVMLYQGVKLDVILPTLGLFAASAFRLMPSANRLLNAFNNLRFYLPTVNVLYKELTDNSKNELPNSEAKNFRRFEQKIQLNNISFSYDKAVKPAVQNVTLSIKKGETVGLIGPSGSGKSTLIDILLGLFEVSEGELLIDGINVKNNIRAWQNQIGYVPQSIYLTDDTLKNNVAFGLAKDKVDNEAVNKAIKAAQLTKFVESLPDGLETKVGERGVRLSGGQRQRIGVARALYHNPEVLVLDEATSALDTETESYVMQAIYGLHESKTIIIVAHRLSTVEKCDKIFQLKSGELVGSGLLKDLI
jgi:ATP-binding cassette, subfamily B, bacterial PglK